MWPLMPPLLLEYSVHAEELWEEICGVGWGPEFLKAAEGQERTSSMALEQYLQMNAPYLECGASRS